MKKSKRKSKKQNDCVVASFMYLKKVLLKRAKQNFQRRNSSIGTIEFRFYGDTVDLRIYEPNNKKKKGRLISILVLSKKSDEGWAVLEQSHLKENEFLRIADRILEASKIEEIKEIKWKTKKNVTEKKLTTHVYNSIDLEHLDPELGLLIAFPRAVYSGRGFF